MFGHLPSTVPSPELDKHLRNLKILLKEKYLSVVVSSISASESDVTVKLLNVRHNLEDANVDGENLRPIEYLQTFNASVTKESAPYYWGSYSVITFPKSQLDNVIQGLKAMATSHNEPVCVRIIGGRGLS